MEEKKTLRVWNNMKKRNDDSFMLAREIYSVCRSQKTNYSSGVSEYEKQNSRQINKFIHVDNQ